VPVLITAIYELGVPVLITAISSGWQCIARGHDETIPSVSLLVGLRLPAETLIIDLEPRSRCRQCDARG
jgi:hypothetical protein